MVPLINLIHSKKYQTGTHFRNVNSFTNTKYKQRLCSTDTQEDTQGLLTHPIEPKHSEDLNIKVGTGNADSL